MADDVLARAVEAWHRRSVKLGIVVIALWLTWGAWFAHHLGWWGAYIFGVIAGANVALVVRDLLDERHRLAESAPVARATAPRSAQDGEPR